MDSTTGDALLCGKESQLQLVIPNPSKSLINLSH